MSLISTDFAEKNLKEYKIIDASWHLPTENRDPYLEYKERHICLLYTSDAADE